MSKETGGPAFPTTRYNGMELRDYFAAQAMLVKHGPAGSSMSPELFAKSCYEIADAMLAERSK